MIKSQLALFFGICFLAALAGFVIYGGYFNQSLTKTNEVEKICGTQNCCKMKCPQKKAPEIKTNASPQKESPSFDVFPFGLPRLSFTTFILFSKVYTVKAAAPLT